MNIFHKVTLASLKKNKTRTVVTIIGIILSAAMICAVTTFASSLQDLLLRAAIYTSGDWHGSQTNMTADKVSELENSGKLKQYTVLQQLGYATADGCSNQYKPYIYLLGSDKSTEEILPIHITSGEYPKNQGEILLPEHLASNGDVVHKIGDMITLELGDRLLDGEILHQGIPMYHYDPESGEQVLNDEIIQVRESRTYKVVGFYERFPSHIEARSAPGYMAFTVMDENVADSYELSMFYKMNKPKEVYDFAKDHHLSGNFNTDILTYSGISKYGNFYNVLYSLCAIVIGLIMFGSVSLIYNAFAISVSERTKQFGLMSSIGATKKQLRRMVLFEAIIVSSIGIPLGILSGIAGIGVTLMAIGDKFRSLGVPAGMRLSVSWASVIIAAVVALITVLISAFIPSRRATKVSAVEAIRQNNDVKAKGKEVRTSKLTYKLFGLSGVLASKHYKRSKKKYRTTILSLFMSIVLFVSASAFSEYLIESVERGFGEEGWDLGFDIHYTDYADEKAEMISPDELLTITSGEKGITNGVYLQQSWFSSTIEGKYLTEKYKSAIHFSEDMNEGGIFSFVNFINDSEFRRLARENGLNENDYFDINHPIAIALDGNVVFDTTAEKFVRIEVLNSDEAIFKCYINKKIDGYYLYDTYEKDGEIVYRYKASDKEEYKDLSEDEAFVYYDLEVKGKINEKPYYLSFNGPVVLLYPNSMRDCVMPEDQLKNFQDAYEFFYTSSDHKASETALKSTLTHNNFIHSFVSNNAEMRETSMNLVTIIQVFSYGFIVLISLIAAANVFNTVSTNISLRRREFAMLKTVGMTRQGFNNMMNFECLLYGSRALMLGLPVAIGISYLIYRSIAQGFELSFHLPWTAIGIATLSVFIVVFATMMYSISKIKKDNPIDALKNENL